MRRKTLPGAEAAEVGEVLQSYGLTPEESAPIVEALSKRPETYVDFMMRFKLGLEKPDPRRAATSALQTVLIGGIAAAAAFVIARLIA